MEDQLLSQSAIEQQTHQLPIEASRMLDDDSLPEDKLGAAIDNSRHRKRRSKRKRDESLGTMLSRSMVEHQLGLSVNLMLFVAFSYLLFPSLRDRLSAFLWLSYPSATDPGMYGVGSRDLYPVATFVVFFTALRASCINYFFMPLANHCGIAKKKGRVRFAEQSYIMLYYVVYWSWGLALFIRNTPSSVRSVDDLLVSLFSTWPQIQIGWAMKIYYLSQWAFYVQQILVIHIEERRKDHWQMLSHHMITIGLILFSHSYRQWRVGNAVLVCMDVVDFIFPLAKLLRYLDKQTACDATFALFVVTWLVTRHIGYPAICWSLYAHSPKVTMKYGVYSVTTGERLSPEGGSNVLDNLLQSMLNPTAKTICWNAPIRGLFLTLLLALQGILIGWFVMIIRVVMRVLRGQGADDTRSDDEDEAEAEDEDSFESEDASLLPEPSVPIYASAEPEKAALRKYIEVESSSDDYRPYSNSKRNSMTTSSNKRKGISSGLNLGEHKDILNRIGCLSEEQLARERELREGSASPRPGSAGFAGKK